MTYKQLLIQMQDLLRAKNFNPAIAYELIIYHNPTIHNKEEVVDAFDETVDEPEQIWRNLNLVVEHHVPISQITHQAHFYGLTFQVNDGVFAPRPETELLVEMVGDFVKELDHPVAKILDLGTGTGVIPITLSRLFGNEVDCLGIDHNLKAIQNAEENNTRLHTRAHFFHADLIQFLRNHQDHQFDVIVSNPPYIAWGDPTIEKEASQWDPEDALFTQEGGSYFYRQICALAKGTLRESGRVLIAFEIGETQGQLLQALRDQFLPEFQIQIKQDYAHHDRIVLLERTLNV